MEKPSLPNSKRLFSLDLIKAMSICAVVSFHSTFVPLPSYSTSAQILEIIFSPLRLCVPCFLVISFILFARSLSTIKSGVENSILKKRLTRLFIPSLFWFGIGALKLLTQGKSIETIIGYIVSGRIFTGAYFLLILHQLLPLTFFFRKKITKIDVIVKFFIIQVFIFVTLGILIQNYRSEEIFLVIKSLGRSPFLYWFFYAFIGFFMGYHYDLLVKLSVSISNTTKFIFMSVIIFGLSLETWMLTIKIGDRITPFEYLMISCLIGGPILVFCLLPVQMVDIPKYFHKAIFTLSEYSLGIFCINGTLSSILLFLGEQGTKNMSFDLTEMLMIRSIGFVILLFSSLSLSMLLRRLGLRNLVC